MLLDDIGTLLQTAGVGTKGTSIFESFDPGRPGTSVTIYEYAGLPPIDTMGKTSAISLEQPNVHVLVRAVDYATARTKIHDVFKAMHRYVGTIGSTRYLYIRALQSPVDVGPDEQGRPRLVCNFRVVKVVST